MPDARIKQLRLANKLTQQQLANATGINVRSYQNIEYGKLSSSHTAIIALARYYDVSTDYLLGLSDDSSSQHSICDTVFCVSGVESSFEKRIKYLREQNCLTFKQAAKATGLCVNTLQGYEYGKYKPGFEAIIALVKLYNVSTDYLLGLTDNPTRH